MKLDLEAKKLVDKYKKRIEKKLEKNPGTIVYHQGRLDFRSFLVWTETPDNFRGLDFRSFLIWTEKKRAQGWLSLLLSLN